MTSCKLFYGNAVVGSGHVVFYHDKNDSLQHGAPVADERIFLSRPLVKNPAVS